MHNDFRGWVDRNGYRQCADRTGYHPGPCAGHPCEVEGFLLPMDLIRAFENDRQTDKETA